jgi:hypothetical protein
MPSFYRPVAGQSVYGIFAVAVATPLIVLIVVDESYPAQATLIAT